MSDRVVDELIEGIKGLAARYTLEPSVARLTRAIEAEDWAAVREVRDDMAEMLAEENRDR